MSYKLLDPTVRQSIDASVLCWLATVDAGGQPNVSPKELFTYADEADEILIAQIASPRSEKNITANAAVCVSFVDILTQRGHKITGEARILREGEDGFSERAPKLREMAGPDFPFRSMFVVRVEGVTDIIAPRYRFYPETTEAEQIASALRTYGVTRTTGDYLESARRQFKFYKKLGERTFAQLADEDLFWQFNPESNSIAVIVNHLSGNMLSRWTDFLTSDGEKEWRHRDREFEDLIRDRKTLLERWEEGWSCLFGALDTLDEISLDHLVYIRNMGHTITEAVNRQMAHYAMHVGQIIYVGRMRKGAAWRSLSIPKGKSSQYNAKKFQEEKRREHFTDTYFTEDKE